MRILPGRLFLTVVVVASLFTTMSGLAEASTVYGQYGYYGPYAGKSYNNRSYVLWYTTGYRYIQARSEANSRSGTVPAGWIGVLPRLYKSNGSLCKQPSDYSYTSTPAVGFDVPTSGDCGSGTYYSYGVTKAWNGNGYNAVYTFVSPNANY
jgi:hypothetical protein